MRMRKPIALLVDTLRGRGVANWLRRSGLLIVPLANSSGRLAGVRLQWESDEPRISRGAVVKSTVKDRLIRFFVDNDLDEIQRSHRRGEFYEQQELEIIARHFGGGVFVDVGANVGNHSLYALAFLDAAKVIAFEPVEQAQRILELNIVLNGFDDRFYLHPIALSDQRGFATIEVDPRKNDNLGATRLVTGDGSIGLDRGDDVLKGEKVDFIKIDTEGFELRVLDGLRETIRRHRPALFVEVENENQGQFEAMMRDMRYVIVEQFRRYDVNLNNVAIPKA